jgi:hypothetical protein
MIVMIRCGTFIVVLDLAWHVTARGLNGIMGDM